MNTIIITIPVSGFSTDTVALAMYVSRIRKSPSENIFLKSVQQEIKINLN